jgi:hypothetical protein
MPHALCISDIRLGHCNFINHSGLRINADVLLVTKSKFVATFATKMFFETILSY